LPAIVASTLLIDSSIGERGGDVELPAQDGRRERVAGYREIQLLGAPVNVRAKVSVEVHIDVAGAPCERDVPASRNVIVMDDIAETKSGHLRGRCRASEETRQNSRHLRRRENMGLWK